MSRESLSMNNGLSKDDAARLAELEDRYAITTLVNQYGEGVRQANADIIASCFAEDARIDHGHGLVLEGVAEIRDFYARYYAGKAAAAADRGVTTFDQWAVSTPVMSNVVIELGGDTAHCQSTCLAIHVGYRQGEGIVVMRGTDNVDDLVRASEGWKIQKRAHHAFWSFEVPGTPLVERPAQPTT